MKKKTDPSIIRKAVLSAKLQNRLFEIGLHEEEIHHVPFQVWDEMLDEKSCWVIRRGPDICPDCGRLKARVIISWHTDKPLPELFPKVE